MPKNTKGGKGYKKGKKGGNGPVSKILILKEDGTEYATLKKNLGNSRFECDCHDGRTRIGHIRGKMQKRVWLATDNLVLVSIRDFQDDKCDIIHKYKEDDKSTLLSIVLTIYGKNWKELYMYAQKKKMKFLSFGDGVLFKINE